MVDDAPLLRELAALFLARAGRVFTASSGDEALALADIVRPDVVFADLGMPGVDGAELCRRLKASARHRHVPVVLLVGSDAAGERERAVRAGADDVIAKPVERLALLETARRLLMPMPRGIPRIAIAAPTRLRRRDDAWSGTTRNLSRGGVFVESTRLVPEREALGLSIELPEMDVVFDSTAEVVWTRSALLGAAPGMGLRFLGLDRHSARALAAYVEERLPTAAPVLVEELPR